MFLKEALSVEAAVLQPLSWPLRYWRDGSLFIASPADWRVGGGLRTITLQTHTRAGTHKYTSRGRYRNRFEPAEVVRRGGGLGGGYDDLVRLNSAIIRINRVIRTGIQIIPPFNSCWVFGKAISHEIPSRNVQFSLAIFAHILPQKVKKRY